MFSTIPHLRYQSTTDDIVGMSIFNLLAISDSFNLDTKNPIPSLHRYSNFYGQQPCCLHFKCTAGENILATNYMTCDAYVNMLYNLR